MRSRLFLFAIMCMVLCSVVMARSFDVSPSPNQLIMLGDPNDPVDPNEPIDIPE